METHSSFTCEPYPGLPQFDRLYARSAEPGEPRCTSAWTYVPPMPAVILPTMFTPPSSHTLGDNQSGPNYWPMNPEEPRIYPVQPRRNGARRKRERRALSIEGNTAFVERDIRVTVNGPRAKQSRKNSTAQRRMELSVQRSEVTSLAPGPRPNARSRRAWKERKGMKFGGIRCGKENLVLAVGEGTIGKDNTSHQYGRAGRSRRTRAEMQPTVESAPTSAVGCFV
ncbi:hypothetical protein EV426DRAFT_601988 [Tirmania nivea]|nr:hypothetical protein EV426DRAFT_601988 [Tirmania nivea]